MSYTWGLVLFVALIIFSIAGSVYPNHEIQELERPTNGKLSFQPPTPLGHNYGQARRPKRRLLADKPSSHHPGTRHFSPPDPANFDPPDPHDG
ncbi:hypothetical protein TSUD_32510 [Trifolium subterraneum]|uniref:Uncharacterized protein n=1 Tax=Trifolium subterraneum TaxID=3900 RepID=A0A2Z6ME55_TRISU|nr:hypothetical protein TSUD_32510 [Trifolium subterraneum]